MKITLAIIVVAVFFAAGVVLSICLDERGQPEKTPQSGEKPASEGSVVPDKPNSDDISVPQEPGSPKRDSHLLFRTIVVVDQNQLAPHSVETERRAES